MITDMLVTLLVGIFQPIIDALSFGGNGALTMYDPAVAAQSFGSSLSDVSGYLPVDTLLAMLAAGFVFDAAITVAYLAIWVYRLLPFNG